jgi:hypothetical protein
VATSTRAEGAATSNREAEARPSSGAAPEVLQPEGSETSSATPSEIQCATNYRRRKTSLRSLAFLDWEFNALSSVDAYLRATHAIFDQSLDVFIARVAGKVQPELILFILSLFVHTVHNGGSP